MPIARGDMAGLAVEHCRVVQQLRCGSAPAPHVACLDCLRPLTTPGPHQQAPISVGRFRKSGVGFSQTSNPGGERFRILPATPDHRTSHPPLSTLFHCGIPVYGHGLPCLRCWRGLPCAPRAPSMGCVTAPFKRYDALERLELGQPRPPLPRAPRNTIDTTTHRIPSEHNIFWQIAIGGRISC